MKIECPHCSAQLRGKPELAGKRVSCPKCGQQVTIPDTAKESAAVASVAKSELWEVRTEDGTVYGPVEKTELDQWVAEDRLDEHCELRKGAMGFGRRFGRRMRAWHRLPKSPRRPPSSQKNRSRSRHPSPQGVRNHSRELPPTFRYQPQPVIP